MTTWDFSAIYLLFPLAVVAVWGAIFLLMVTITRWAARDHDGHAEAEEAVIQEALGHTTSAPKASLPA